MKKKTSSPFSSPEVRVVEASAGSGKTYALAKRYVQILLNPQSSEQQVLLRTILAITFTNKAAFEMKTRILDFLKKIALKSLTPQDTEQLLTPLGLNADQAAPKAARIMREIIHHYNFFQVQTIDSFVNALLSGCAFKIGLSSNFRIKTNWEETLLFSLEQLIAAAEAQPKTRKVFDAFIHQYLFLENKTGWFPKKDILGLLAALYQKSNLFGQDFELSRTDPQEIFKLKSEILTNMQKLQEALPEATDARFVRTLDQFLADNKKTFDIDTLSNYFNREVLPARKNARIPARVGRLWDKIRTQLGDLSELEAVSLFDPYVAIHSRVQEIFKAESGRNDVLFLEQLNKEARALFDEEAVTVEELYYRLATRFRHYLMDEFQDTSVLQWRNLFLMVEEALSTGGTLFYVGDKKQAIYGFRGGEVGLFDHIKTVFGAFNVKVEPLSKNYRSHRAIVDFNNRVFSTENLRCFIAVKEERESSKNKSDPVVFGEEDYQRLEQVFAGSQQIPREDKPGGLVRVELIQGKKKEERDEVIRQKLIDEISGLRKRYRLSDIAVLTRDNAEVEQMTSWLLEEGIFVESERTLNIRENPLIRELIHFLTFLHSPIDNLAFAEFVLGDVFAAASGIPKEEVHDFVFSLRPRLRAEKDLTLYREFRDRHPETWDRLIDEFFRNIGLYPLYELMMSVVERLGVLRHFPDQQGFVMRFLELIKMQEDDTSDAGSFLENFDRLRDEELFVNVSDTDAIRILTIHKAKGLEFPVVLIPFLGMEVHVGSGGGLGQRSFILDFQEDHLRLLRIKNKYLGFSPRLKVVHHREYVQSFLSELNSIYVALTRASQEMIIFIPERSGNSINLINFLIPEDCRQQGSPTAERLPRRQEVAPRRAIPVSEYHDWIGYLKDEFMNAEEIVNRNRIQRGEVLHYLLAQIIEAGGGKGREAIPAAIKKARMRFPWVRDWTEYGTAITAVLEAPDLQRFFDITDGTVACEQDLINRQGHTRRIDRLIIKPDEAWIVDFKSTCEPSLRENYDKQVREYMQIVGEIYPGKKIRGYLIYLDACEFEEIGK